MKKRTPKKIVTVCGAPCGPQCGPPEMVGPMCGPSDIFLLFAQYPAKVAPYF
jgi:hypothetical protein